MTDYLTIPQPIDTSDIQMPEELNPLFVPITKNVHDAEKLHPMLIPYEDLREEEKVYDRNTSVETLKLILKLGFIIEKSE